jgi:hypothetical protein
MPLVPGIAINAAGLLTLDGGNVRKFNILDSCKKRIFCWGWFK